MIDTIAFWVLGPLALISGFGVFRVSSMARATFLLLTSFLAVGGLLLALQADFLGGILVLMVTGEMAIMAVFMIMYMMNPAGLMPMSMYHNKAGSMTVAVATFVVLAAGILVTDWPQRGPLPPADATTQLGVGLFGPKMIAMLTMAVTLFAAMVASVLLATGRGRYDRLGDDLKRRGPVEEGST